MQSYSKYFSVDEEYALSENREECADRLMVNVQSLYHKLLARIDSLAEKYDQKLVTSIEKDLEELKEKHTGYYNTLKNRFVLAREHLDKDGKLSKETADRLIDMLNVDFNYRVPSTVRASQMTKEKLTSALTTQVVEDHLNKCKSVDKMTAQWYDDMMRNPKWEDYSDYVAERLLTMEGITPGNPGLVNAALRCIKKVDDKNKLSRRFDFQKCTFAQMQEIRKQVKCVDMLLNPSFIQRFLYGFCGDKLSTMIISVEVATKAQMLTKIQVLESLYDFIRNEKRDVNKYACIFLLEIMYLKSQIQVFEPSLVKEFLGMEWVQNHTAFHIEHITPYRGMDYVVRMYIDELVLSEGVRCFAFYSDQDYVSKTYEKKLRLSGKTVKSTILSESELTALVEQTKFEFTEATKNMNVVYGEKVTFDVKVKNVNEVVMKVYEIHTYNYFSKHDNCSTIDVESLELEGLTPLHSITYSYSHAPIIEHNETFSVDTLNHRGAYVIEFFYNTQNARILVKYGSIRYMSQTSIAGTILTLLDENNNLVQKKDKKCRILVGSTEILQSDDDEFIIPCVSQGSNQSDYVLVCIEETPGWEFCERIRVPLIHDNYDARMTGICDCESLVSGNTVSQVLFRISVLLDNQILVPLQLLNEVSLNIHTECTNNVTVETVVTPELKDNEDYVYTFCCPEGLLTLSASLECSLLDSLGKKRKMTASCSIYSKGIPTRPIPHTPTNAGSEVNHLTPFTVMTSCFMLTTSSTVNGKNVKEYKLLCCGEAGEPIMQETLVVTLQHRYTQNPLIVSLDSDDDGFIHLGDLSNVISVSINSLTFRIKEDNAYMPTTFTVMDSEKTQVLLPIICNDLDSIHVYHSNQTISGVRYLHELENEKYVSFVHSHFVQVKGLMCGEYEMIIAGKNGQQYNGRIIVKETEGEAKNINNYVVNKSNMISRSYVPLHFNAQYDKQLNKLTISLMGGLSDTRVHIFSKSFTEGEQLFANRLNSMNLPVVTKYTKWPENKCNYYLDRSLHQESSYVLKRNSTKHTRPGNALPSPGLLLQPRELSSTTTVDTQAKAGSGFGADMRSRCAAEESKNVYNKSVDVQENADYFCRQIQQYSYIIPNLKPQGIDSNGNKVIEVKLGDISTKKNVALKDCDLVIVAVDRQSVYQDILCLRDNPRPLCSKHNSSTCSCKVSSSTDTHASFGNLFNSLVHDSKLAEGFDSNQHISEIKSIDSIQKDESINIQNLKDMECIRSLFDVYLLLKTIGTRLDITEFSFITKWSTLTTRQKEEYYREYGSSELSVFIYYKDRAFFEEHLLGHLKNKIEKNFIDKYLTQESLAMFVEPSLFSKLNAFEQCLLLTSQWVSEDMKKTILNWMKMNAEESKLSPSQFDTMCDIALNMKNMNKQGKESAESALEGGSWDRNKSDGDDGIECDECECESETCMDAAPSASPSYSPTSPSYIATSTSSAPSMRMKKSIRPMFGAGGGGGRMGYSGGFRSSAEKCMDSDGSVNQMQSVPAPCPPPMMAMARGAQRHMLMMNAPMTMTQSSGLCGGPLPAMNNGDQLMGYAAMPMKQGLFADDESSGMNRKAEKYLEHRYQQQSLEGKDQSLYVPLEETKEYAETFYYKHDSPFATSDIPASMFWLDYAEYLMKNSKKENPTPFLSKHLIYCHHSVAEVLICLAVLDIPFTPQANNSLVNSKLVAQAAAATSSSAQSSSSPSMDQSIVGSYYQLTAGDNCIVVHKTLKQIHNTSTMNPKVIILQRYIDTTNSVTKYRGKMVRRYVQNNEFVRGRVYKCEVNITNLSEVTQDLRIFYQIPSLGYPIDDESMHHSQYKLVQPNTSVTFGYHFYFPKCGVARHYPAQCYDNELNELVNFAQVANNGEVKVVDVLSNTSMSELGWQDICTSGSDELIIKYIQEHKCDKNEIRDVYWRCSSQPFFEKMIDVFRLSNEVHDVIWSFGLYHRNARVVSEYLRIRNIEGNVGKYVRSKLYTSNPLNNNVTTMREYKPLVNSRYYQLSNKPAIMNDKLRTMYVEYIDYLKFKSLSVDDYMLLTYYLILQDRIDLAHEIFFSKVCEKNQNEEYTLRSESSAKIQFDYMLCYFDCFTSELKYAKAICPLYEHYPIVYWRERFDEIREVLNEATGVSSEAVSQDTKSNRGPVADEDNGSDEVDGDEDGGSDDDDDSDSVPKKRSVFREPGITSELKRKRKLMEDVSSISVVCNSTKTIEITTNNLRHVNVNFYEFNAELVFSFKPFVRDMLSDFSITRPVYQMSVAIQSDVNSSAAPTSANNMSEVKEDLSKKSKFEPVLTLVDIPEQFQTKNILIEVCSGIYKDSWVSLSHNLSVVINSKAGILHAYEKETRRVLPCCYVKVYVKKNGNTLFLKDGYTDIRGYFDYFSVSNDNSQDVSKIAIFVCHDSFGSLIREVNPPVHSSMKSQTKNRLAGY